MYAIYARKSRLPEDYKTKSIEDQINEGLRFLEDGEEYKVYEDSGVSGGLPVIKRPALRELVKDIKKKNSSINKVFFLNQSRMERNPRTYDFLTALFTEYNIDVYQSTGKIVNSPQQRVLGGIMSYFNEFYLEELKERWDIRHKTLLKEGKVLGVIPYGYKRREDGMLVIDEEKEQIVKDIFKWSLEGKGFQTIADKLNSKEIVPNKQRKASKDKNIIWQPNHVNTIIKNTIYYGKRTRGGVDYEAPAIFEQSYWQKVNDNLQNNKVKSKKRKPKEGEVLNQYLLNDLMKCGKCGMNYYGVKNPANRMNAYVCSSKRRNVSRPEQRNCGNRSVNIDAIESLIWWEFFLNGKFQELVVEYMTSGKNAEAREELEQEIKGFDKLIADQDRQFKNLVNQIKTGSAFASALEDEAQKIQAEKERLQGAQYERKNKLERLNFDLSGLEKAKKQGIDFEAKKATLKEYIDKIEVLYKEPHYFIRIHFKIEGLKPRIWGVYKRYYLDNCFNTLKKNNQLENYMAVSIDSYELLLLRQPAIYLPEWG